jgi:NAD(P)-dependent dehydrogenase (short-subunit alcohol dehydrogenase family)
VVTPSALVTGGSSGIGYAIAEVLLDEGYALTVSSRRPDKLAQACESLRARGGTVAEIAADLGTEEGVAAVVDRHRSTYGRLDVLVNNAGVGIGGRIEEMQTKHIDLQFAVNLRAIMLFYREALPLLRETAAGDGSPLVVNMSSITGKRGHEWLSVYSAIKHGVVGFTQAMDSELTDDGIRSCVLCPAYVDTDLSDYKKGEIPAEEMITTEDVASALRFLVRLSENCAIPEIMFTRPGELSYTNGGVDVRQERPA